MSAIMEMTTAAENVSFGNLTGNFTEQDDRSNTSVLLLIITGVAHILLVVVPSLVLGTIILYLIASKEKKAASSTVSIMFIFITSLCTIAPPTYGILMDLSLITDVPLMGECTWTLYWMFFSFFHLSLTFSIALLSIMQYAVLRWGDKKWNKIVVIILMVLVPICLLVSLTSFTTLLIPSTKVRGSLCEPQDALLIMVRSIVYVIFTVLPAVITVIVFSYLSYRYVKRNIVCTEKSNTIKSVLQFLVLSTTVAIIFRLLPSFSSLFSFGSSEVAVRFLFSYTPEISYTLYLLFIILCVRKTL